MVTTRKYARISDEEIEMKYLYTNAHPDVVVIVEPTIVKGINVLKGMPEGGLLLINTSRSIEYMLQFIPNADILGCIATVDADAISGIRTVDFSGSEGGVDTAGLGAGLAAPILGALAQGIGHGEEGDTCQNSQRRGGHGAWLQRSEAREVSQGAGRVLLGNIENRRKHVIRNFLERRDIWL